MLRCSSEDEEGEITIEVSTGKFQFWGLGSGFSVIEFAKLGKLSHLLSPLEKTSEILMAQNLF